MSEVFIKKGKRLVRTGARRLTALVLCVMTLLSAFVLPAAATAGEPPLADTRTGLDVTDRDAYILSVSTGFAPGDAILYIAVRYVDRYSVERTEFVMPHDNALSEGYEKVLDMVPDLSTERSAAVKAATGYEAASVSAPTDGLRSGKSDMYYLEFFYGLRHVVGIDIFMRRIDLKTENAKSEWTCNDLALYRVNKLYGIDSVGFYSSDYFIDFDGEIVAKYVAKQEEGHDFSVARTDELFRLGDGREQLGALYTLKTSFPESEKYFSSAADNPDLTFRFDFADTYGGGIEALACEYRDHKASLMDLGVAEVLALDFTYADSLGGRHTVTLPVITSAVGWAVKNSREDLLNKAVVGIAQQGDTLIFNGKFPNFDHMTGYTLNYSKDAAEKAGVTAESDSRRDSRLASLTGDGFSYVGVSIFNSSKVLCDVYTEGASLICTTQGNPLYYCKASTSLGQNVQPETGRSLFADFKKVEEDDTRVITLLPKSADHMYIIVIETDVVEAAGTNADISAVLHYKTVDGYDHSGDPLKLSNAVREFYGYWSGEGGDIAYASGVNAGGKLIFSVPYSDVDYFTSADITIDEATIDDWQFKAFSIYEVNSLPKRSISWLAEDWEVNGNKTDRQVTREFSTYERVAHYGRRVLLNHESSGVVLTFTGGGGEITERDVNWEAIKDSMTFNEAKQNLGFTKTRYKYQVKVKVKSNLSASEIYGDCGSNNKFYFSLTFENGSSGYVQANQQLSSDGFRAGQLETFTISLNRNYGDLRAVKILPDDMMEEADVYDKMNIDYIEVVLMSTGDVSRSWRIDNVGWIDIDFQDTGAEESVSGRKLRSEFEMAHNLLVNRKGYAMNFLVTIATGEYPTGVGYEGGLLADIHYLNTSGSTMVERVDVISAMALYANKQNSIGYVSSDDGKDLGFAKADPAYMLRSNTIDRFVVTLPDVKKVLGITLYTEGTVSTRWKVNSIQVYRVIADGSLFLNNFNEYQRDGETEWLCSSVNAGGYLIPVVYDSAAHEPTQEKMPIDFSDNTILINSDSWNASVEREPTGNDDTLNIYIFAPDDFKAESINKLTASIQYQTRTEDKTQQVSVNDFTAIPEKNMLYRLGVGARGLSVLYQVGLSAKSSALIDYAIIQQVRSGVVINTFFLDYAKLDVKNGYFVTPSHNSDLAYEKQTLTMQFNNNTDDTVFDVENRNIAVAINYRTTNDPDATVYTSPYIYFTDQDITSIRAGQVVSLTFEEKDVKEITGITISGIGDVTAGIDSAMVLTYVAGGNGTSVLKQQYNFADEMTVPNGPLTFPTTKDPVAALDLTFTTNPVLTPASGGASRISLDLTVTDSNDLERVLSISDLSGYVVSGGFDKGEVALVRMLIPGATSICNMKAEPHSGIEGKPAEWYVDSVSAQLFCNSKTVVKGAAVNRAITEGVGLAVNFSEIVVSLRSKILDAAGESTLVRTFSSKAEPGTLTLDAGQSIVFTPSVAGSMAGYGFTVDFFGEEGGKGKYRFDRSVDGTYTFEPKVHYGKEDETYTIVITSEENTSIKVTVTVTVHPGVKPAEPETTTEPEDAEPVPEPSET